MVGTLIQQKTQEIFDAFEPTEGLNTVYYGRVRNGKTYSATADIIELLNRGEIVYANWRINFEDFDERKSFGIALVKFIASKKYFYVYKKENFHYINVTDSTDDAFTTVGELHRLVGVHVFIDEGQWIFNSHSRVDDIDSRHLILEGGHYCRTLNVITQRPTNILVDIRSQVNIWYKCQKVFQLGGIIRFLRTEYQDMKDNLPDEDPDVKHPEKAYWANAKIYNAYETHAMRRADAVMPIPEFDVYELSYFARLTHLVSFLVPQSIKRFFHTLYERIFVPLIEKSNGEIRQQKGYSIKDIKSN